MGKLSPKRMPRFYTLVGMLCLAYLSFELFYTSYAIFSVDDFWFAHHTYEYKSGLPYKDFPPYKTVLGYYLLLLPMTAVSGLITPLLYTKYSLALLNAALFFITALWLKRYFNTRAIIASLLIILSSELVLNYSTNIRVDLLAYWCCLFSVLLALEKKHFWAGCMVGLGFLISQKALWYLAATDIALASYWLCFSRDWRGIQQVLIFNLAACFPLVIYIAAWSSISSLHTVLHSIFYEAYIMFQLDWYNSTRKLLWTNILFYNTPIFLLWPLSLFTLFITFPDDTNYRQRFFIVIYASVIMIFLILHKQVFPYYMLALIPASLLLYASCCHWLLLLLQSKPAISILWLSRNNLWIAFLLYLIGITTLMIKLKLGLYFPSLCISVLLAFYLLYDQKSKRHLEYVIVALAASVTICLYTLAGNYVKGFKAFNGQYQRTMLVVMNTLLTDGSDYVAGTEFFYNKTQPIAGMRHLMGPAIAYLKNPTDKLRKVMLPSLYESPDVTTNSVITALENSRVKFYVNNYRITLLPPTLLNYLHTQYTHYWGSIYLYAPQVARGQHYVKIKFDGQYQLEGDATSQASIDGKSYMHNQIIYLSAGNHSIHTTSQLRLKLIPDNIHLNPSELGDDWARMVM